MEQEIPRTKEGLALVPSVLLVEALHDLRQAEESPDYVVNMGCWYKPPSDNDGPCEVCLAGATVAFRMGFGKNEKFEDILTNLANHHRDYLLLALNNARRGMWDAFVRGVNKVRLWNNLPELKRSRLSDIPQPSPYYADYSGRFYLDMREAVTLLAERGL